MCCGKKRALSRKKKRNQQVSKTEENTNIQPKQEHDSLAHFQYLGKTGLTVTAPRTRKRYRFDYPGAIVAIDPRDRRAMAAVSILRPVEKH